LLDNNDLLFDIYLRMNGQEIPVGQYVYTYQSGHQSDLPNYPPMVIGDMQAVGETLFIGVRDGVNGAYTMRYGLDILDTHVVDNVDRIGHLRLTAPVLGVAVADNLAYLANGWDGFAIAD